MALTGATVCVRLRWATSLALSLLVSERARAEELRGVVVDQTSLALPGVTLDLLDGSAVVASTTSAGDGRFILKSARPGLRVRVALPGFATRIVADTEAARIVLSLAGTTDSAEVTATVAAEDSPTAATTGAQVSRVTAQRLPAGKHAREALPLLPTVIRGADGLLHIDGVRPHESPLLLDGFDVTDPATGLASIDLPLEGIKSVGILRDPMTATIGGALGSLAMIETRSGAEEFEAGIEGFVPRPRLTGGGFGKIEGFSPRAFFGGSVGRARYFSAAEFDFDRIPVPGVTSGPGNPDTRQIGGTAFSRVDFQISEHDTISVEGLFVAAHKGLDGLSPLRTVNAALNRFDRDIFGGIVNRLALGKSTLVTLRLGFLSHRAELSPNALGEAQIAPSGWSGSSFSSLERTGTRAQGSLSLQRDMKGAGGPHNLTVQVAFDDRSLQGVVTERPVTLRDAAGIVVRKISFGPPATVGATDYAASIAIRDLWQPTPTLQVDGGVRADYSSLGGWAPSVRVGFRYALGKDGVNVLKGGLGTFIGTVPLSVPAFAGFPLRFDETAGDPSGGGAGGTILQPVVSGLSLPRAFAANARLERALSQTWDALLGVSFRRASRLATLDVRPDLGLLRVASNGRSKYREAEVGLRHKWGKSNVLFASYTRSSSRGELNDFSSLFANGDVEVLQPGGVARLGADAPHRLLAWGTFDLPAGFGVSPAMEWRSGFPYATVDAQRQYVGPPNTASFPSSFSLNLVVYKALTIKGRQVKLNLQLFNATNHFNPRDVFSVVNAPLFGTFTNSVGPTVRGDITLGW